VWNLASNKYVQYYGMRVSEFFVSVTLSHDLLFDSWPWRAVACSCPWVPSHFHPNPPWTLGRTYGGCTLGVISLTPWFSPYPVSTPPVLMLPPMGRDSGKSPYTPTHLVILLEVGHRSGVMPVWHFNLVFCAFCLNYICEMHYSCLIKIAVKCLYRRVCFLYCRLLYIFAFFAKWS